MSAGRTLPPAAVQQLVVRAQAGDAAAFGQLYEAHVEAVFGYVAYRVQDPAVAEDLTQDIFLSALRALPRFRWQGSFAPWLLRCAHNRVVNHWRSLGRRAPEQSVDALDDDGRPLITLVDEAAAEGLATLERVDAPQLGRALATLTALQQQVVALRFGAGLSLLETAQAMERSENAIKNLQHHALAKLRRALQAAALEGAA